jgi:uncharacterized protein
MKTNPFFFGNEVSGSEFCNRVKELDELKKDVAVGLNVLLYAPRRFGKTSLLKKLKDELKSDEKYQVIFFDFFSISSVDEFIQRYFDTLAKGLETTTDKIIELFKSTLTIRPNITVNISQNGESSFGLGFSRSEQSKTLEDVLNIPFEYAKKKNIKVVVIFDEFQEIEQFNIEKKLRSVIQSHSNSVSYIFCGSKKSILSEMFNDESRAFYKSVKHVPINEITLDDWKVFANEKFSQTGKSITNDQISQIFQFTNGFPYYMQQLLFSVWDITGKIVEDDVIKKALSLMIEREYDLYSLIWSSLTPNQKRCLKYILTYQEGNLYTNDKLGDFGMNATTLKSTLEALMKKDVIDRKNEIYYLVDPFMKQWVERL